MAFYQDSAPLPRDFYGQPTLDVARDLLGKALWRRTEAGVVGGIIVETEAYIAAIDPASHNYRRPTKRGMTMFGSAGHAYVYFTYGMHYCLNVVTEGAGISAAVLLRALVPIAGRELMVARCPRTSPRDLCRGPARICQALALTTAEDGTDLTGDELWLSHAPKESALAAFEIGTSPRIGISRGMDLPWRFFVRGTSALSGPSKLNRA